MARATTDYPFLAAGITSYGHSEHSTHREPMPHRGNEQRPCDSSISASIYTGIATTRIRSLLLKNSAESPLITEYRDWAEATQGGCNRSNPRALALLAPSSTANFHTAPLERSDLLCNFSNNRTAFEEQRVLNSQAKQG